MAMTNVGSPLRIGSARSAGIASGQPGAKSSPIYCYSVAPATLQVDNVAAAQTVTNAAFTLAAGTGVTTTTINGTTYYDLGVARNIRAVGASASVAAVSITVTGRDEYFQAMTQAFSGPTGTATTSTTKAFRYVQTVTTNSNTTSAVSIGTGDTIGMPYKMGSYGQALVWFNQSLITNSVGITVADTATPSATTGDVRGTYTLASASDGSKQLTFWIFVTDPDTLTAIYGATQT